MAIRKMNLNIFRAIGTLCNRLDDGWSIARIKETMNVKDQLIADLDAVYHSSDYQNFIALRSGLLEDEPEKINEATWRAWGDPLTLLGESIKESDLYMFSEEHTSYLSDMVYYQLAPLKTICQTYWTEYDSEISHNELLAKIRKKMIYKGIKTARNLRIMSPQEGYAQYIKDFANSSRSRMVRARTEFQGGNSSPAQICQNFNLTPISGTDTGLKGMVYVESKCLPEIGERNYPYLYYVSDDVAELSLESSPRVLRGKIRAEELNELAKWVKINKKAISKYWNHEPVGFGMPYESIEFMRSVKNTKEEYVIGKNKKRRYNGLSLCPYMGITPKFILMNCIIKNSKLNL